MDRYLSPAPLFLLVQVAKVLWWYYFSKVIEFMDTIFFVLRKKRNQITFLHVYHHATMFNIWWCVLNWIPCGQSKSVLASPPGVEVTCCGGESHHHTKQLCHCAI